MQAKLLASSVIEYGTNVHIAKIHKNCKIDKQTEIQSYPAHWMNLQYMHKIEPTGFS